MDSETRKFQKPQSTTGSSPIPSKMDNVVLIDKGGRRVGIERRSFSYTCCIPERRSGMDRRSGADRRTIQRLAILPEIETPQDAKPQDSRIR